MSTSQGNPKHDLHAALKNTLVLILAGGRGTRLMNLTDGEAKPAIPFGGKFRIVDFPLSNCINSGLRRVAVLTQYKGHTLIQHVQRGWGFLKAELGEFIELWPAQQQTDEEAWYRGTADAVWQNLHLIRGQRPTYVLVLAGDHVYKQDYSRMLAEHIERGAEVTVGCVEAPKSEAHGFGVVHVDETDHIVSFLEKPKDPPTIPGKPDRCFVSMGIYVFTTRFMIEELERDADTAGSSRDFGKDLLPKFAARHRIYAHRFENSCVYSTSAASEISATPGEPYWRDVGTLDSYWSANIDLTSVTPELDLYDPRWPIWTYQEQRPAAKFVFNDDDRRGMAVDSLVSSGCVISGGLVRRSLLFNSVRVNSYSVVEDSVILPNCNIGRRAVLRKCVVDRDCNIPEGMVIGVDPERDAKHFHRTEKGVTLVTSAMLDKLRGA